MAKKVNKSQAVRDYVKVNSSATNKEISEALGKQGIRVSPNHVANIKTKSKIRRKAVKTAVRAVGANRGIGIPEIKAAFALLKVTGGLAEAKAALAAAEEIKTLV